MSVVLVTGASSGFGAAIAAGFARRDDKVVASMRHPDAMAETSRDALLGSGSVELLELDVTSETSRSRALKAVMETHGRLDVLVNNAGMTIHAPAEEVDLGDARRLFETNFWGPFELIRSVVPVMRDGGGGRIVNITSVAAVMSPMFESVYGAAKHALDAMTGSLDIELHGQGIRVCSVAPGPFSTSLVSNTDDPSSASVRYQEALGSYREFWAAMLQANPDLSPVVEAAIAAATDIDPKPRYLVGGALEGLVAPAVEVLNEIQRTVKDSFTTGAD